MSLIPLSAQAQLAQRVLTKRQALRCTQAELAKRAGTSQAAIARLEAGLGNPTLDLIQRVVTALDLQLTLRIHPDFTRR